MNDEKTEEKADAPKQGAVQERSKAALDKFMGDLSYYLVHQMRVTKNGEISVILEVEDYEIVGIEYCAESMMSYKEEDDG